MATYITLYKWTDKGIANLKGSPERMEAAIKSAEAMGGKVLGLYVTMGEHDLVAISEWPTDEAAAAMVLWQASLGNVRTTSMRAFTREQFASILKQIP